MLIFDRFTDTKDALAFAAHVEATFERQAWVYEDEAEAFEQDPFPFALDGTIVHVERFEDPSGESAVLESVAAFGGRFAGT